MSLFDSLTPLPNAKKKANEALNNSYVFASAKNFSEAANQIISGLETNGYSRADLVSSDKKDAELEWKGEDRVSNDDAAYKVEIGEMWAKIGGGKLHFFLIHNGNVEEALKNIKRL